jgi:hypothetical protein
MSRRWLATLLLAVSVGTGPLAACSSAAKSARLGDVDGAIQSLAAGGVAVMEDVTSMAPVVALTGQPSAMRFTRWQMRNLVAEADAHTGYLGSELDAIAQPPAGAPPFSTLIGAWLTRKDGALAQYAAGVMGSNDYKQSATLVFPTIVVLAFVGDIARVGTTALRTPPRFDVEQLIAMPAEAEGTGGDACSTIAGWVSSVVTNVVAAVTANGNSWLATLWNTVVTVVGVAASIAFASLTRFLTNIATICGTLMQVASMFKPWSVTLAADPTTLTLSETPGQGQFVATLQAQDIPWPATLIGCVQSLSGVTLESASYTDAPVTWKPTGTTPGLAVETSEDATLLANKTAAYHFQTKTEPAVTACPRTVPAGTVGVTVSVARSDITRTLNSLEALITNQLPGPIQSYLSPYIGKALDTATTTARDFAAPHESAIIPVSEEIPDPLPGCGQSPPPNAPTTQPTTIIGHGTLPGGACASVALPADTEPSLQGGVVFIPTDDQGNHIDMGKMMGSLMSGTFLNPPNGAPPIVHLPTMQHGPDYDATKSSTCVIGTPPAKIVAFFTVIPKGTAPYHLLYDLRTADAQSPRPCRSAIGIDLLNYYNADCRDGTFGPGVASVTLSGPTVEYIIVGGGEMSGGPSISAGDLAAVLKHIAQRSRN